VTLSRIARGAALRDWLGTFGTNMALLGVGLLTGVLAARILGPEGRGRFAELLLWGNLVAQLGALGLPAAATIEAARSKQGGPLLASILVLACAYSAASVAIFALVAAAFLASSTTLSVAFVAAYVPANILGLSLLSADAGAQRFRLYNALRLIPQCVYLALLIGLAVAGLASAGSLACAALAGSALVPLVRAFGAGSPQLAWPDLGAVRRLAVNGLRFYATSVVTIVRDAADRMVILAALDPAALGLYAVAMTVAGLAAQNIAGATATILLPKLAAGADEDARRLHFTRAFGASLLVGTLLNGLVAIVSPFLIPIVFGMEFSGAAQITAALCLALSARGGTEVLSAGLRGMGDWTTAPLTTAVTVAVFVPSAIVLVGAWGTVGVAAALAMSEIVALGFALSRAAVRTRLPLAAFVAPGLRSFSPTAAAVLVRHRGELR